MLDIRATCLGPHSVANLMRRPERRDAGVYEHLCQHRELFLSVGIEQHGKTHVELTSVSFCHTTLGIVTMPTDPLWSLQSTSTTDRFVGISAGSHYWETDAGMVYQLRVPRAWSLIAEANDPTSETQTLFGKVRRRASFSACNRLSMSSNVL